MRHRRLLLLCSALALSLALPPLTPSLPEQGDFEPSRAAGFLEAWQSSPIVGHLPPPALAAPYQGNGILPAGEEEEQVCSANNGEELGFQQVGTMEAGTSALDEEDLQLTLDEVSAIEAELAGPSTSLSPATSSSSSSVFPPQPALPSLLSFFEDPQAFLDQAITGTASAPEAAGLRQALARIRQGDGLGTVTERRELEARVQGWMQVLRAELEKAGPPPPDGFFFSQPRDRFAAPTVSIFAWPPTRVVKNRECHAFGTGGSLSEEIAGRSGELDLADNLVGNVDYSFAAFDVSWSRRHPFRSLLNKAQRDAMMRFNRRVLDFLVPRNRIVVFNGGDVRDDLLLPYVADSSIRQIPIPLRWVHRGTEGGAELLFVRRENDPLSRSSLFLRRRHPQALGEDARPGAMRRATHDLTAILLRLLAFGGDRYPPFRAFSSLGFRSSFALRTTGDGDSKEDLMEPDTPWHYRIHYLARREILTGVRRSLDDIALLDRPLLHYIQNILRMPPPSTDPVPCPPAVSGSILQLCSAYLHSKGAATRRRNNKSRRRLEMGLPISAEDQVALDVANAKAAKQAARPEEEKQAHRDHVATLYAALSDEAYERKSERGRETKARVAEEAGPLLKKRKKENQKKRKGIAGFVLIDAKDQSTPPRAGSSAGLLAPPPPQLPLPVNTASTPLTDSVEATTSIADDQEDSARRQERRAGKGRADNRSSSLYPRKSSS